MEENTQENKFENTAPITNNTNQIAGAIIVAGIIIAGAIMIKGSSAPTLNNVVNNNTEPVSLEARPVSADDHIVGNRNAKIVILEYSDLDCPYCKNFHATMKQVVSANKDVAWVYRHYPIPQLHPDAYKKAEATECAWEQGGNDAFWAYTDKLFETNYPLSELPNLAGSLGLNVSTFNTCLTSQKYTAKIQADITDGSKMGVSGTPSSFILKDGKVVDTIAGAQRYETIVEKLRILR